MYKHKGNRIFSFCSFFSVRLPYWKSSSCVTLSFVLASVCSHNSCSWQLSTHHTCTPLCSYSSIKHSTFFFFFPNMLFKYINFWNLFKYTNFWNLLCCFISVVLFAPFALFSILYLFNAIECDLLSSCPHWQWDSLSASSPCGTEFCWKCPHPPSLQQHIPSASCILVRQAVRQVNLLIPWKFNELKINIWFWSQCHFFWQQLLAGAALQT